LPPLGILGAVFYCADMMPRFNNRQAAENFASFAAEVSGAPCSVHNVRNAWVVAPTHVQPEFWRIANAWGYLFGSRPDEEP